MYNNLAIYAPIIFKGNRIGGAGTGPVGLGIDQNSIAF